MMNRDMVQRDMMMRDFLVVERALSRHA